MVILCCILIVKAVIVYNLFEDLLPLFQRKESEFRLLWFSRSEFKIFIGSKTCIYIVFVYCLILGSGTDLRKVCFLIHRIRVLIWYLGMIIK